MKFGTKSVHIGVNKDTSYNSVTTPIYPSSTFAFEQIGKNRGYDYTRSKNPTRFAAEQNLAALEGGVAAYCTSTGMAAETAVLHLLKPDDHVIAGNDIYGGTYRLMAEIFSGLGILFDFIDMTNPDNVRKCIRKNTKMIWIETPSNPLLNIVDIKAVTDIASRENILTVADNTFMSPYFQKPFELGVDVIVHSTTKYINGHSDVVGGVVICKTEQVAEKIFFIVNSLGLGQAPFDSWLVLRGVKTLSLRMEKHNSNAGVIAEFLYNHPKSLKTYYPGLAGHPGHEIAKKQMSGFGGMVSFDLDTGKTGLDDFFSRLKYFSLAESLGGVESLIEAPWFMSHASMTEDARKEAKILPNNVRISIGIEDVDDLIEDLDQALA